MDDKCLGVIMAPRGVDIADMTAWSWCMQVIGPLFTLYDTNAAAAATIPGFNAGVLKSLSSPNPPVRHHPLLAHAYVIIVLFLFKKDMWGCGIGHEYMSCGRMLLYGLHACPCTMLPSSVSMSLLICAAARSWPMTCKSCCCLHQPIILTFPEALTRTAFDTPAWHQRKLCQHLLSSPVLP